jgi:hypothetical protein
MTRLSPEDYRLLDKMNQRGRIARISNGRPRHGAERLVEAGLATSRALNMSDVEYEMTALGRRAFVLKRHGIQTTDIVTIEPHRHDDGLWHVKVSCAGDPAVMMTVGAASKLIEELRSAGDAPLADQFQHETERARRFATSGV